jgi:hypothetical protein
MMTAAEEKAKELFDEYYLKTESGMDKDFGWVCISLNKGMAKQCALIAVDLKIESYNSMYKDVDKLAQLISGFKTEEDFNDNLSYIKDRELKPYLIQKIMYWQDVKRETQKL